MPKTITSLSQAQLWLEEHEPFVPKPGDLAPDFELSDIHGNGSVRLSDYRGQRPVALIFGSFT